jgi:hypothetical protein
MIDDKECDFCGASFIPKRSDAKFCSESCKQKAYLSRKNNEIEDMRRRLDGSTRQTTDNETRDFTDEATAPNTDSHELTDNISSQFTDTDTDNSRKTTQDLRLKDSKRPSVAHNANGHFTDSDSIDDDPFRQVEVTVKGKKYTMSKFTYDCLAEDGFENCELYDLEEEHLQAEEKQKKAQARWSYGEQNAVSETNKHLKGWIKTLLSFKRIAIYSDVKNLIKKINEYRDSFSYRYLPKDYAYRSIIEDTILSALKKLSVQMEVSRIKRIKVEIAAEREALLMNVLLQIP